MILEVAHLKKSFGSFVAVDDLSFSVQQGEVYGFLGQNGAGKSTTLKMLTGYLQPTAGNAKVCGLDLAIQPLEVRKKLGYLAEQNALYPDLYVREYLSFIARVHHVNNIPAAVEQALALTRLETEAHKTIGQLSKGFKQRVGLAAALIHNPEVLILDEPTSGLDPNQLAEIRTLIKQQGQTKTVLFSTHILQEVEALCDRVIIINKGTIVADSPLNKLAETVSLPRRDMKLEEIFRYLTGES